MGLSFLNKKTWHPGSFANIEKVWIAEQKQRELERKQIENIKKLKEERQIEELKKMQVEAGLIPASHLQRLDWIYQAPEMTSNITTAEEFLLGKPLKEEKQEEKRHFTPVFQESYSNPNNEVFTRIHEDPMYVMKKEELRARKEIEENPYRMKMLLKEIESKIMKEKLERKERKERKAERKADKKSKKEKRDKKEKHKHKHTKKSSSSDSDSSATDRHHSKKGRDNYSSSRKLEITTPGLLRSKLQNSFGLVDKEGNKIKIDSNRNLGPDMSLYKDRRDEKDRELSFKKKSESGYKNLSEEEREQLRRDMENKAKMLETEKLMRLGKCKDKEDSVIEKSYHSDSSSRNTSHKPDFLKSIDKSVYSSGSFSLDDRLKMNKTKLRKESN